MKLARLAFERQPVLQYAEIDNVRAEGRNELTRIMLFSAGMSLRLCILLL